MNDVNLETIIDMQSWCRTWPPNGSSRIREKTKTSQETKRSLQKFLEPNRKPEVIYTDNSLEFGKVCEDLSWNHCTSTPHRSETHGIAERAVRRVKEGTSAVLLQSGLDEKLVGRFYGMLIPICETFKISCLMGKLHTKDVLENHLKDRSFRLVHWLSITPISAKDQSRIHQFGKKVLPGLFLGYALYAGRIWKGDVLVADTEELETMDASVNLLKKRLNATEVIFPKENGKFIFPAADGRIKLSGGNQELRTPTLIREHPIRGEGHRDFLGERATHWTWMFSLSSSVWRAFAPLVSPWCAEGDVPSVANFNFYGGSRSHV